METKSKKQKPIKLPDNCWAFVRDLTPGSRIVHLRKGHPGFRACGVDSIEFSEETARWLVDSMNHEEGVEPESARALFEVCQNQKTNHISEEEAVASFKRVNAMMEIEGCEKSGIAASERCFQSRLAAHGIHLRFGETVRTAIVSTGYITESDGCLILGDKCPGRFMVSDDRISVLMCVYQEQECYEEERSDMTIAGFSAAFLNLIEDLRRQRFDYVMFDGSADGKEAGAVEGAPTFNW